MHQQRKFESIFKINNCSILPPVITTTLRKEILQIREMTKELKLQRNENVKELMNQTMISANDEAGEFRKLRKMSYTLSSPVFTPECLPHYRSRESLESMETIIDGPLYLQSFELDHNAADKSSKDLKNEIDKRSTTPLKPDVLQVSNLRHLIERQKQEYLNTMEALKSKFTNEQQELLVNLDSLATSTPLNYSISSSLPTDDEFTDFKSCLQVQNLTHKNSTIVNDYDAQIKAAVIINSHVRGFLTRRLLRTFHVQENIRNIKETIQIVLNFGDIRNSPVQNVHLKTKLFRQLQSDLYNLNETFTHLSTKEKMKIIASDRLLREKMKSSFEKKKLLSTVSTASEI